MQNDFDLKAAISNEVNGLIASGTYDVIEVIAWKAGIDVEDGEERGINILADTSWVIDNDMCLHTKVPLISLARLMHLGITRFVLVLR